MVFLICDKHNKVEKSASNFMTSAHICMERSCSQSYKVLCQVCKKEHKNHAITLLNIEDVSFLLERLIKLPFKAMAKPFGEALNILQQLKLIKEFRKKIDLLQKQIQAQSIDLINQTEILMRQYTQSQLNATTLSLLFDEIQQQARYQQFSNNCQTLLDSLNYNVKRDKLQYGNPFIYQTEQKRVRIMESVKYKIEEVRDYSMKIIQVILNNYQSDDQNEDSASQQKHYSVLKEELLMENDKDKQKEQKNGLNFSQIATDPSQLFEQYHDEEVQTYGQLFTFEEMQERFEAVLKEKQSINQQLSKIKQKYADKQKLINKIEAQMRGNRQVRNQTFKIKQDLVNKIIEIWNQKGSDCEDAHI